MPNLLLGLLIANLAAAVVYLLYQGLARKDWVRGVIGLVIIALTMGFGAVFLALSSVYYRILRRSSHKQVSLQELSFSKEREHNQSPEDLQEAREKAPIEEVILVANREDARRMILNVLKQDYFSYIQYIHRAVESDDSEISHYAATAVVDVISRFKDSFARTIAPGGPGADVDFVCSCARLLATGVLSESEQRHYLIQTERLARALPPESRLACQMLQLYLFLQDMEQAQCWLETLEACPKDLYYYKGKLQYEADNRLHGPFMDTLRELKRSDVALDPALLELVRLYQ